MRRVGLIALAVMAATGCAKPWQTARTVVTVAAESVNAAQNAVADQYEQSGCEDTQDVAELTECVDNLATLVEYIDVARASLLEGEAVVDLWQSAQDEPGEWRGWLTSAARVLARLGALIEAAGVDVPGELISIASTIDRLLEGSAP